MPIGMESRPAATAAVGPFMDSLRMRCREGGVNVPNRRAGKAGECGQCAARGSREAYHHVAVIIGGGQKAGQLTSGHASMAQAKLCSRAHHSGGSRGSPCHRCTSTVWYLRSSRAQVGCVINASWKWRHAAGCRKRLLAVRAHAPDKGVVQSVVHKFALTKRHVTDILRATSRLLVVKYEGH